jgi:hypothetical protein
MLWISILCLTQHVCTFWTQSENHHECHIAWFLGGLLSISMLNVSQAIVTGWIHEIHVFHLIRETIYDHLYLEKDGLLKWVLLFAQYDRMLDRILSNIFRLINTNHGCLPFFSYEFSISLVGGKTRNFSLIIDSLYVRAKTELCSVHVLAYVFHLWTNRSTGIDMSVLAVPC